ncbi:potassium channel family protein [Viridibacterium curvum]|uniref:Potassium channel protein n=1 Tax=Viridibacterium curvum TaxID=1101404 RepID=A0ABP9QCR4_9RHOO
MAAPLHPTRRPVRSAQLARILRRIGIALGVFVCIMTLGTVGFLHIGAGHASLGDALYMTLITVTTVGYSEIVPVHSTAERLFAGMVSLVGFGNLTFLFTSLTVFFLEADLDLSLRRRRMEKRIARLSGHYIVCGFGRVGRNVASELQATQRAFVAIEPVGTQFDDVAERFADLLYLNGDATDDDVLRVADIADAAGVFAVTGDDSVNLMITITARQLNPKLRVVARCHELRNVEKLRRVGADAVVSPDFTGGMRIASLMLRPAVVSFLDEMQRSEHKVRVEEVAMPAGFRPATLQATCPVGPDHVLIAVRSGKEWLFNPRPEFLLSEGDVLIVMTSPAGRQQLESALRAASD